MSTLTPVEHVSAEPCSADRAETAPQQPSAGIRAIGYVRVSHRSQAEDGLSLDAQREQIVGWSRLYGVTLVDFAVDEGLSAKSLRRPGLQATLRRLGRGDADALIVAKLDRLTRSVRDLVHLVDRYFAADTKLISVAEHVDTSSASGRMVLNVLTSIAEWERDRIGERVRDVQAYKRSRGEHVAGAVPFGSRLGPDGRTLEVNPTEEAVVQLMRALRRQGNSYRAIAHALNETGAPARGRRWHTTSVRRILCRVGEATDDQAADA